MAITTAAANMTRVMTGDMTGAPPAAPIAAYAPLAHTTNGLDAGQSDAQRTAAANQQAAAARTQAMSAGRAPVMSKPLAGGKMNLSGATSGPMMNPGVFAQGYNAPATGGVAPDTTGLNFMQPGAAEAYFAQNQDKYGRQTGSGAFAQYIADKYGQNTPDVSNNAQDAYTRGIGQQPQLSADLGPYYENAKRRAAEGIDQQMAARGLYSSSAATDRIGEAFTDLEAQRAKDEANYGLQRSADTREWAGLGGQLAQGADNSSLARSNNERGWMDTIGNVMGSADDRGLARLNAGMSAAGAAQEAQRSRGADAFQRQFMTDKNMSDMAGSTYDDMFSNDQGLLDKFLGMNLGMGSEVLNGQKEQNAQNKADNASNGEDAISLLATLYGLG